MGSLFQIAKNTFRECVREPIFILVLVSALCLIGILPGFTLFVFREQVKLVVDSAMATMMVFGWIVAVLCASHAIAREISNGTALLVLSKPVQRPVFILAKIGGILAATAVFWFLTGTATLIAVRVAQDQFRFDNTAMAVYFGALCLGLVVGGLQNYVRRSSFPMAAVLALLVILPLAALLVYWMPAGGRHVGFEWGLLPALVLILYSIWAMGTLATALSTRFALIPNLLICAGIFVLGLMSDYVLGRHAAGNPLIRVLYACVPNWQLFWMADAMAAHKSIPLPYLVLGGAYIACFVALFILLAVILFSRREVGTQSMT